MKEIQESKLERISGGITACEISASFYGRWLSGDVYFSEGEYILWEAANNVCFG